MWICVGPRDRATKPSRGWLLVAVRKPRLVLVEIAAARNKVTAKQEGCDARTLKKHSSLELLGVRSRVHSEGNVPSSFVPASGACPEIAAEIRNRTKARRRNEE